MEPTKHFWSSVVPFPSFTVYSLQCFDLSSPSKFHPYFSNYMKTNLHCWPCDPWLQNPEPNIFDLLLHSIDSFTSSKMTLPAFITAFLVIIVTTIWLNMSQLLNASHSLRFHCEYNQSHLLLGGTPPYDNFSYWKTFI